MNDEKDMPSNKEQGHAASLDTIEKYLNEMPKEQIAKIRQQAKGMGMSDKELLEFAQRLNDHLVSEEKSHA